MNETTYIKKLLSHINGKNHKQIIEAELTDHITEKEKWYEEIGYDPETAAIRAEEDMGDPDSVGEQMRLIEKKEDSLRQSLKSILLVVSPFFILFLMFVGFFTESTMSVLIPNLLSVLFAVCCFEDSHSILILLNMPVPLIVTAGEIMNIFFNFIAGNIYIGENEFREYAGLYRYLGDIPCPLFGDMECASEAAGIIAAVLLFALFIAAFIISVKTNNLKNRRHDYYIGKAVKAALIGYMIFDCAVIGVLGYQAHYYSENYYTAAQESLNELNETVLDKINSYKKTGELDFSDMDFIYTFYSEDSENSYPEDNRYYPDRFCHLKYADSDSDGIPEKAETNMEYIERKETMRNNYSLPEDQIKRIADFARNGGTVREAPKPYELRFDRAKDIIKLNYYDESLGEQSLLFSYSDGEYRLSDSTVKTKTEVSLTDEQYVQYAKALAECFPAEKSTVKNKVPDAEPHIQTVTFGVNYDGVNDTYEIMQEIMYFFLVDYKDERRIAEEVSGNICVKVKFEDGKAVIKNLQGNIETPYGNENHYADVSENDDYYDFYRLDFRSFINWYKHGGYDRSLFSTPDYPDVEPNYTYELDGIRTDKPVTEKYDSVSAYSSEGWDEIYGLQPDE